MNELNSNSISNREINAFELELENENDDKLLKLDQIINNIDLKSNIKIYLIIALVLIADGGEGAIVSFLLMKFEKIWNLTTFEKGLFGTCGAIGALIGSGISGNLSDNYGRKIFFVIGNIITSIFCFLTSFSINFKFYMMFRILYGFGVGMSLTSAISLVTEISPTKYRVYLLNLIWIFFPLGELYCAVLADYFLIELDKFVLFGLENWRLFMIVMSIPCLLGASLSIFIIESPRFLFSKKRFDEGFHILSILSKENKLLSEEDKKQIIEETNRSISYNQTFFSNYKQVFGNEYLGTTILISLINFLTSFTWSGITLIMPKAIEIKELDSSKIIDIHKPYYTFIISALFEIPCTLISCYLVNNKKLKRKGSLILGFVLCFISSIFLLGNTYFSSFYIILKFLLVLPYSIVNIYINEVYPTKIRSTAIGIISAITRISGITSPLILIYLFDFNFNFPFILISLLMLWGIFLSSMLSKETFNKQIE